MSRTILGIDIGAVALSTVELDEGGCRLSTSYSIHKGEIREQLVRRLGQVDLGSISHIALTGSAADVVRHSRRYHSQVACATAARRLHPGLGGLLIVGGEKFSLARFGPDGRYQDSRFNSSCAAGTGSFLDQQAERLGLAGSAELSRTALLAEGDIPKIASRCAVFAKTDLLHAQQDGFTLEAICEGLCRGLAVNVFDTLFTSDRPRPPVVFAGGVAQNQAVARHLAEMLGHELIIDEHAPVYGALGAGLLLLDDLKNSTVESIQASTADDLLLPPPRGKKAYYPPLALLSDDYPDFKGEESYVFEPRVVEGARAVEVDIYRRPEPGETLKVALGVDVGSTSTKAVFLDENEEVLAGFYTRTSGRPLLAVRGIFEAVDDWRGRDKIELEVAGAAATGAGRKFIGAMIGAGLVVDEITAHAAAACRLDPGVDTIIEIGGQDSKFTNLSRGTVTQSVMNHVCAAGTGSFIEEQAGRLDCPLDEYDGRTSGREAPLASDRCTVFMERDINHLLSAGFDTGEVLATVLHSVRENYLTKVARGGTIGERICFQGATAKNRSLVAAFEQQLQKPVKVSRYCHLTGAWGAALLLNQTPAEDRKPGSFRGLDLYREQIEVRSEVCDLCNNHCNLRLAEVRGETVAYGFLCGRDYDVQKFVSSNRSGFDLLKARRRHFAFDRTAKGPGPVIGIPAALYLVDELPFWRKFFDLLGVRTVTSQRCTDAVSRGKRLAAAEFCAPMAAFHGHVAHLADKADFIFTPIYLEADHKSDTRRQYCYYSQYAPSLISTMEQEDLTDRCLMPLVRSGKGGDLLPIYRLHKALKPALGKDLSLVSVTTAYREARRFFEEKQRALPELLENARSGDKASVVLIGRPYTALSPAMNKLIPEILGSLGVKAFYQDMLPADSKEIKGEIEDLLGQIHWKFAADLLTAAWKVAKTPGLYPVVITSFMCAPDSCTLESFRRIMDKHEKPYLILQIDEHDSRTGYETRIEAAVRSFENHRRGARPSGDSKSLPLSPVISRKPGDKVVLIPPWDTYAVRLFCANLIREGIDARMLDETELLIQKSLRTNTGQCIPLNAIVQDFIDYVERHDLDPAGCVLWQPKSSISCNIGFFPQYAKGLLESHGGGFEKAEVYAGETSGSDISVRAVINNYFAYFFAGSLRRAACKLRPYEVQPGSTDAAVAECLDLLSEVMRTGGDKLEAARQVVDRLLAVEVKPEPRPQVAIFGDLYARDNDVMNQGLIDTIEENGGEVLTTPYSEYGRIVIKPYLKKWLREGLYKDVFAISLAWAGVNLLETKYVGQFERVLGPAPQPKKSAGIDEVLALFSVDPHHTGESFDNILKVFHLVERYPNLALFVQTNPAFCCPSLVTEAMGRRIERATGVPVVTVTYDGTASNKNEVIIPYLQLAREISRSRPSGSFRGRRRSAPA